MLSSYRPARPGLPGRHGFGLQRWRAMAMALITSADAKAWFCHCGFNQVT